MKTKTIKDFLEDSPELLEKFNIQDIYEKGKADAIDEVIKKLSESEDTILSDRQYYALMELKVNT